MTANQKRTGLAASMPAGLAMAGAVSLLWTLAAIAVLARLVLSGTVSRQQSGYVIMAILLVAAAAGAFIAKAKIKRRTLLTCALSGAVYFVLLLAITALFFGGQYQAVGVTALLILGGSMLPAFEFGKGRRKRYKIPSR